jgi:hypothetical protein
MPDLERLRRIAETEFLTLVRSTTILRDKLRVVLVDGSYIDFCGLLRFPAAMLTTGRGGTLTGPSTGMTTCLIRNGRG